MSKESKISPELLQKLKNSINIIEVVGEHVVLRKSGANYSGLCPFHSERTPSFSVNEQKQLYHCYGCKKGGDLVTFVMDIVGIGFREAIEELADRAKFALPEAWKGESALLNANPSELDKQREAAHEKKALAFKLNRFAAAFFHQKVKSYPEANSYLVSRGVTPSLVDQFYLGAVTPEWDSLAKHLTAKQAPLSMANELGLIRPSTKGMQGNYDLFRHRAIFPILNLMGKVAGFGGRSLGDETPKYLNSPESLIFQKGKLAYGLYQAQKYIREKDEVILVEGYFDVLAMHAAGFQNVVATCGTSLTPDHLKVFKKFASRVLVLFDGDKAGVAAMDRAMEVGLDAGWVLYGARMPEGLDPDQLVRQGKEEMLQVLNGARPLLDVKMEECLLLAQQGPEDRTQALKKLGDWLGRLHDPIGREVRMEQVQKKLGVSRHLILQALGGQNEIPLPQKKTSVTPVSAKVRIKNISKIDAVLTAGVLLGGDYLQIFFEAKDRLPPQVVLKDLFESEGLQGFASLIFEKPEYLERLRVSPDIIFEHHLEPEIRNLFTEILLKEKSPITKEQMRGAVMRRLAKLWAQFSQCVKRSLADAETKQNAQLQAQLMKEYLDVQRKMKEFSNFYDED